MGKKRSLAALGLVLILLCTALPARAAVFCSDVRVLLSIGKQQSFSVTPVGSFTLQEDPELSVGNDEITVSVVGGRIAMTVGNQTVTAASLTLMSENYGGRTDYIRLRNAEHGTCTYLGNLTFDVYEGAVRAVNTLPVEQYLYGVVPHEMSNAFPVNALKAQAVCARSYAVARCSAYASRAYDLVDTSKDQVYRGYASKNTRAIAAVDATCGQVLTYEGDIIEAYYSASNGGQTERTGNVWENDLPYYGHADDPYDLANASSLEERSFLPEQYTEETMALMDPLVLLALEQGAYEAAGREVTLLSTVAVTPKNPSADAPSRCYTQAEVVLTVGENGQKKTGQVTVTLELENLKYGSFENTLGRIGAKKTRLRMRGVERGVCFAKGRQYPGWYLTERRYGHGIGLSQRGAQERARMGQAYTDILSFYFQNTALHTVGDYDSAPRLRSQIYRVKQWGLSGIPVGVTAEQLMDGLSSKGEVSVVTAKGNLAKGPVCTGWFVRTTYDEGKAFFDLPIVIFGDVDGDGAIGQEDIAALQNHLLHAALLTGPRRKAADVNHDGEVDALDLLLLIQAVNQDATISQGGA